MDELIWEYLELLTNLALQLAVEKIMLARVRYGR